MEQPRYVTSSVFLRAVPSGNVMDLFEKRGRCTVFPWWREMPYLAAILIKVARSSCSLAALGPINVVSSAKRIGHGGTRVDSQHPRFPIGD